MEQQKLGSGIKLIFDSCKKAQLAKPEFNENGDFVKVTFQFKPEKNTTLSDEEILLKYFKTGRALTIHEIIDHLGRLKNTVFKILHKLMRDGFVVSIGKGRATRYALKSSEKE